jgi:Polyketide cyclase / dehydrase and lipid transport
MARHRVTATARINAPASVVYGILADYHRHHPRILPTAFRNFVVKKGGIGAGTVFSFDLRIAGRTKHYHSVVAEPEPGAYLVESYPDEGSETSFRVTAQGNACTVTIASEFDTRGGPLGAIERTMSSALLRWLFADELKRLAAYAIAIGAP